MGAQAVRLSNVDIDNALKNKDFEVLFQPIFDLGNGALARMETFVRWRHAALGLLPPGAFISFFESQGRMSELTRYVLAEALDRYCAWRGPTAPGFSINLALSDLTDEAFAGRFALLLRERGFPADLITLECPMPPVTMEAANAVAAFQRLAETGARLAIEVRGRANDLLRQIDPFPFDEIKTGGAAILRFARTVRGPGLSAISELLDIAAKSNAAITAVGVEDQASLSALRGLGFAAAQGNHLGKVGPLEAFAPSRVNDVRALLGLKPLSAQDLHALFRTEAPAPHAAEPVSEEPVAPAAPTPPAKPKKPASLEGDVVERLAARIAREAEPAPAPTSAPPSANEPPAKRPPSAAALKQAAIARAKKKAAENAAGRVDPAAARMLQERLSQAFGAQSDDPQRAAAFDSDGEEDHNDESAVQPKQPAVPMTDSADKPPARRRKAAQAPAENGGEDKREPDAPAQKRAAAPKKPASPAAAPPQPRAEPAAATAAAQPARARAEPASPASGGGISLSVAGARAAFRPGMRVAAGRPVPPPQPSPPAPLAAAPAPVEEEIGVAAIDVEEPGQTYEAPTEDAFSPEPAQAAAASPGPRRKRKKSFLKRTVIPYPTHFWPKWVRRSFRRRREAREAAE